MGRQVGSTFLRMSSSLPADMNSSHFVWVDRFQKNLKAAVGDRISVMLFPNNQLGKERDVVQSVRVGAIDAMISGASVWATAAPEIGVLDLGYLFNSNDHAGRALDGTAGTLLSDIFARRAKVRVLGYGYSLGARNVYAKTRLRDANDIQGLKIRVIQVPNFIATLTAMGAVATPLSLGEVYAALQTGVVDGVEQDAPTVLSGKFYEIAKHCLLTQHMFSPVVATINQRSFAQIPAELQPVFLEAAREATIYQRNRAAETETAAFDQLKKAGVTVTSVDKAVFRKAMKPVWADFVKKQPATQAIIDATAAKA